MLLQTVLGVPSWGGCGSQQTAAQLEATPHTATPLGLGLMGVRTDRPGTSGYLLPFEIVSVHLLVVLIGAAYLARAKRSKSEIAAEEYAAPSPRPPAPGPWPLISMNLLTQPIGLSHYLFVATVLFVCGVVCMAVKRNAVGVLMGVELVLNGANLNFVAFGAPFLCGKGEASLGLDGQLIALFVIVLAAAEAAVAPGHRLVLLQQPRHDQRQPRRRT